MMEPAEISRRAKQAAGGIRDLGKRVANSPVSAVISALVAGFLFGLVLRLFERGPEERRER
jgi:hypothetical protein